MRNQVGTYFEAQWPLRPPMNEHRRDWDAGILKAHRQERTLRTALGLVGVAQWTEHWPVNRKVTGSVPGQGTNLGCKPGLQLGACGRQPFDVSPSLFPSLVFKNTENLLKNCSKFTRFLDMPQKENYLFGSEIFAGDKVEVKQNLPWNWKNGFYSCFSHL